jgi:NTP pyrophosphatase (non-canonical NTP hydrolase)
VELKELMGLCKVLDEKHGFPVKFESQLEKYNQITKDLVGLLGEVGEFANIVKKINRKMEKHEAYKLDTKQAENNLKEELADSLIYIIRIANILEIDLTTETLAKIEKNKIKYGTSEY